MKASKINTTIVRYCLLLLMAVGFYAPQAHAARYFLSDNPNLVKGCSGTIEIKIDTEGSAVIAGDSTIAIDPNELSVNQLDIGSVLPMQVFNQISANEIKLSGARLPLTGSFTGNGTFGYINFTPDTNASSGTFDFSQNLVIDNNVIDQNVVNVISAAVSKTYNFNDRYNIEVDGVGFCTPDNAAPNVQFVTPPSGSANNPVDTNIIFSISDNRAGVDIGSLSFSINSINYTQNSPEVSVTLDAGTYRIETDPVTDFDEGVTVPVTVSVCDLNTPANCTNRNMTFGVFTPAPAPAICGDAIVQPANGEQCDDGNIVSGDGCSALCLLEVVIDEGAAATCSDGLHNQGEGGIDCGGPCLNACPTCVDGELNQGEESVDCGGPCPSCDLFRQLEALQKSAPVEQIICEIPDDLITICHYPPDDPDSFYSLVIPEYELDSYQAAGDTIGPCAIEEVVLPVAPEVEEAAVETAQVVEDTEEAAEVTKTAVQLPDREVALSQIDLCRQNPRYSSVDFRDPAAITNFNVANPPSFDFDGDGLSNRTECYLNTDPTAPDTDNDGCLDGDELNQFDTDPLDLSDCKIEVTEIGFSQVLVTDPKPGWTLGTQIPRFSGVAPLNTRAVTLTAFHADQKFVKALTNDVNALLQARDAKAVASALESAASSLADATTFIKNNQLDYDYADFEKVVSKLNTQVNTLKQSFDASPNFVLREYYESLQDLAFGSIVLELGVLLKEPVIVGSTSVLSETVLADQEARSFEFLAETELEDQKLYNIVATATLAEDKLSSSPIRFGVNTGFTITKPVPRTLGGKLITGGISFDGKFVSDAIAQSDGRELEIEETRPTVTGDTEFGSQVFAIWNSVVLSSSVISDSEQGTFEIQAPRNLETNTHHRVTLYAVKSDDDSTLRSESVDVFFVVKGPERGIASILFVTGSLLLIVIAYVVVRHSQQAKLAVRLLKKRK